jgi:hypothetical protein
MPKPGPRTITRYSEKFRATAVRLSELPGMRVQDVAASLYIHPFMLSRWRTWALSSFEKQGSGCTFRLDASHRCGQEVHTDPCFGMAVHQGLHKTARTSPTRALQ